MGFVDRTSALHVSHYSLPRELERQSEIRAPSPGNRFCEGNPCCECAAYSGGKPTRGAFKNDRKAHAGDSSLAVWAWRDETNMSMAERVATFRANCRNVRARAYARTARRNTRPVEGAFYYVCWDSCG